MKVNIPLELTETDLRKVRAGINRSGMATRKEIRIFVDRVVRAALGDLPEPKVRRKATAAAEARIEPVKVYAETPCAHCSKPYDEHARMGHICPLSLSYGRHTKFKAVTA